MSRREIPDITDVARAILRNAFGGLHTHVLRRHVHELRTAIWRDDVARQLLGAQQAGDLVFRDRRWHSENRLEPPGQDLRGAGDSEFALEVGIPHRRSGGSLQAIPVEVLPGVMPDHHAQEMRDDAGERLVGWALLRRLLPHYAECLRLGGATRLAQEADRHSMQFYILRPRGRWWPDAAGPRCLRIERSYLAGDFLEGLYRRRSEPLLLGYAQGRGHFCVVQLRFASTFWRPRRPDV